MNDHPMLEHAIIGNHVRSAKPLVRRLSRLFILLIVGGVIAFWLGSRYHNSSIPLGLFIEAKNLDLGELWEQDRLECTVPIRNTTAEPIVNEILKQYFSDDFKK